MLYYYKAHSPPCYFMPPSGTGTVDVDESVAESQFENLLARAHEFCSSLFGADILMVEEVFAGDAILNFN